MMTSTPDWEALYQQRIDELGYDTDEAQRAVLPFFAMTEASLNQRKNSEQHKVPKKQGLFSKLFQQEKKDITNISDHNQKMGVYCYGGVGRGKTFLMDLFCEHTEHRVMRLHFHRFMAYVHDLLKAIGQQKDPLVLVASKTAETTDIVCIDEFFVNDITDAMILYRLLNAFFNAGIAVITTSNIAPKDLYKNGLQRSQFLPAIDLIEERLNVFPMQDGIDFRRQCLIEQTVFFDSHNPSTKYELKRLFAELSQGLYQEHNKTIEINHRNIPFLAKSSEVIWFDFKALCDSYRAASDYIVIADTFACVILSDIPALDGDKEEAARRFLTLIDELYDRRVVLIISSDKPINDIYVGSKMQFEFERLKSRLFEMQSDNYFKEEHLHL